MIEGSWSASHGDYSGTFTITSGATISGDTIVYPIGSGTGGTSAYPTYPVGPIGDVGVAGPYIPTPPSPEMVKVAERLLHDPDFEVGKFLAKVLAKHLEDNIGDYLKDEVVKKYLPK